MMKLPTTTIKRATIVGALAAGFVAGGITLAKPSEAQAAQRRMAAGGNCTIRGLGSFDVNGDPSGWNWSDYEDKLHGYDGKMYLAGGYWATCAIPSDTALPHDSITYANLHVRFVENDCTGTSPSLRTASISYASGTYSEGGAISSTQSGCNFTFTADNSSELYGWSTSSYYPMVRVYAASGEPVFIHGFWMHD